MDKVNIGIVIHKDGGDGVATIGEFASGLTNKAWKARYHLVDGDTFSRASSTLERFLDLPFDAPRTTFLLSIETSRTNNIVTVL